MSYVIGVDIGGTCTDCVVLDEAGYDPSLRFVLVAAILFVLFLIIVLLNKLIS